MKKVLFVVPARSGSSFVNKNRYPILGRQMVEYTLDSIPKSHGDVVVTTDDHYIKAEADVRGFSVDERPANLANDRATLDQVMYYIYRQRPTYDVYVCLPPTSPLRTKDHIVGALTLFEESRADSLISVYPCLHSAWREDESGYGSSLVDRKKNRQDVEPFYIANGAIFIASAKVLHITKTKIGGRVKLFKMDEYGDSVDVHGQRDICLAECYLKGLIHE